jgi:predicted N-acetyltransferase YhbS
VSAGLSFLEPGDRAAFLELERRVRYPTRPSAEHLAHQRALMASPWARRAWRVAALRGTQGELAAAVSLLELDYRLGSRRLRLAGLCSLAVAHRFRGLGLGRELMERVHEHVAGEGRDGVLAFSTIGGGYFARLGYRPLPLAALEADLSQWRVSGPPIEPTSIARAYEPRDFDAVRDLYNTTASLQRLAVLRDADYWEFLLQRSALGAQHFPAERTAFLVGERDGRVVSYMRAGLRRGGSMGVLEYGFEAGCSEDLTLLCRAAIESFGDERPKRLRSVVPTRFRNWCPSPSSRWQAEKRNVLMLLPFGGFGVPDADSAQDERLIWAADMF